MISYKWIGAIAVVLLVTAVALTCWAFLNPDTLSSLIKTAEEQEYVAAMDKSQIMSIQIVADESAWADMLANATQEEYISATIIINGTEIKNVGIRPKGNSSLSTVAQDNTTDRFSFKIEFDRYITGQTWLGLDKLVVNNMQGDASYMKEYLSYDIMNAVGVDTPLYAFADISVNGETWGFYLAVEALEESYAARVYGKGYGEIYKPESMGMRGEGRMNEFLEGLEDSEDPSQNQMPSGDLPAQPNGQNGGGFPGDMPSFSEGNGMDGGGMGGGMGGMSSNGVSLQYIDDQSSSYSAIFDNSVFQTNESDYKRVITALEKLSAGEDLAEVVDVEAVLKYFAAHTVVVNLDSYVSNMGHNYYLYEDDGQLTILPWDYNLAFGGFQSGDASTVVNFPIDTPVSGVSLEDRPLLGQLLEVPEYMELYHSYLSQITDNYFNSGVFEQTIDSLDALISSYVQQDPTAFYSYEEYQEAVPELKKLGLLRSESIEGQLEGTIPSTSEGQSANSAALVDTSDLTLSKLGNQGMGMGMRGGGSEDSENADGNNNGRGPGFGGMQNMDRTTMQKAMQILQEAGSNPLTEEQLKELQDLGLSDEQISSLQSMAQGGFMGQRPGGMQNNGENGANSMFPGSQTTQGESAPGMNPWGEMLSQLDWTSFVIVAVSLLLLLGGILFVLKFKRRRNMFS